MAKLAMTAGELLLEHRRREALHDAGALYAAQHAGSKSDLDEDLEAVSVERLLGR